MSKIIKCECECAICKGVSEQQIVQSNNVKVYWRFLDGKAFPLNNLSSKLMVCPYCLYCNDDIRFVLDSKIKKSVFKKEYKELFEIDNFEIAKLHAASFLNAEIENYEFAAYIMLNISWYYEKKDAAKYIEVLSVACFLYETYFGKETTIQIPKAIIYVEILRRLGRFADALNTIEYLISKIDSSNEFYDKLLLQEKLCESKISERFI